jgi:hypothetical protein
MITAKAKLNRADLIAPCGINCRLCHAYVRERNSCPGCRAAHVFASEGGRHCSLRCERLAAGAFNHCSECDEFPCTRLLHLHKRYRTRYAASPLSNLAAIRANGIRRFVRAENEKWACPHCGSMLCMHKPECLSCGHAWHRQS